MNTSTQPFQRACHRTTTYNAQLRLQTRAVKEHGVGRADGRQNGKLLLELVGAFGGGNFGRQHLVGKVKTSENEWFIRCKVVKIGVLYDVKWWKWVFYKVKTSENGCFKGCKVVKMGVVQEWWNWVFYMLKMVKLGVVHVENGENECFIQCKVVKMG